MINIEGMKMVSASFSTKNSTIPWDNCKSYKEQLEASRDAYNRLFNVVVADLVIMFLMVIILTYLLAYYRFPRRRQIEEVSKFTDTSPGHFHFSQHLNMFSPGRTLNRTPRYQNFPWTLQNHQIDAIVFSGFLDNPGNIPSKP